jgi:hypothetical protein
MLERIEDNGGGVRVVLVEDASRFARSVIAQELGVLAMQARGVTVRTAGGDNLTQTGSVATFLGGRAGAADRPLQAAAPNRAATKAL